MPPRLVQLLDPDERRIVAAVKVAGVARRIDGFETTYSLARTAIDRKVTLAEVVAGCSSAPVDLLAAEAEGRLLAPIDHADPAHCHLTGTGLTHLGFRRRPRQNA